MHSHFTLQKQPFKYVFLTRRVIISISPSYFRARFLFTYSCFYIIVTQYCFYLHVLYENAMQSNEGRERQFCSVAYLLQCFPFWSCTVCVEIVSGSVAGVSTIMNTLRSQCLGILMIYSTTEPSAWICCWDSFLGKVDKSW